MAQKGLKEALAAIEKEPRDLVKEMAVLINKRAEQTSTAAKEDVNVDTGYLRSTINAQVKVTDKTITANIGANAEYAVYVHENPNLAGHKFLEKNFNKYFGDIEKDIKKL